MSYSSTVKTNCILWYAELKSPIKVQRKFRTKYGKNEKPPSGYCMKIWLENFKKTGSIKSKKIRSNSVDRQRIAQCLRDEPQQSLSRVANQFDISNSAVRTALKSSGFKRYRPQVVHALKNDDKTVRVTFAETMLDKINQSPRFLEMILKVPRSPDLTPMDFFVWGFIKSKVYVRNHENMSDLKASIVAAFQELTAEMVSSTLKNMEKRLKLLIQRQGEHIEN